MSGYLYKIPCKAINNKNIKNVYISPHLYKNYISMHINYHAKCLIHMPLLQFEVQRFLSSWDRIGLT